MKQEKRNNENFEHCKSIAERLEMYTNGNGYKCPHCDEVHDFPEYERTEHENEHGDILYICPACEEEIEEAVSIWDYFQNDIYDIEYRIGSDKEYRSVRFMVACGGPNIYIDTKEKSVLLYWWNEYADYPISYEACNETDTYFEELYHC